MAKQITYCRVYEETSPKDGKRVLVDRVWPRGMRKEEAHLDEWLRDVAPPSSELRKWYGHEPAAFPSSAAATWQSSATPDTARQSNTCVNLRRTTSSCC